MTETHNKHDGHLPVAWSTLILGSLGEPLDYILQRPLQVTRAQIDEKIKSDRARNLPPSIDEVPIDGLPLTVSESPEVAGTDFTEVELSGSNVFGPSAPSTSTISFELPVAAPPEKFAAALSLDSARNATNFGRPGGLKPGEWLLNPLLRGKVFDVVIRNSSGSHGGKYDNMSGTLTMPGLQSTKKITLGTRHNSLEVVISPTMATKQPFKLWTIYPQHTNEHDPIIHASAAVSVLHIPGMLVLIIGPGTYGNTSRIGLVGTVHENGSILVGSAIHKLALHLGIQRVRI
ncbi:hypothetical protein B0H11DRAFT_1911813 [Mycena galericulata]|nr:hypothetical protein B0H11DRAFT_1911813 [Mycena galericulata]